jgi:TPR repeat protein
MLGNKLAKGEDTRRDVRAARRYLQQAAGKGLTEANEALQKL